MPTHLEFLLLISRYLGIWQNGIFASSFSIIEIWLAVTIGWVFLCTVSSSSSWKRTDLCRTIHGIFLVFDCLDFCTQRKASRTGPEAPSSTLPTRQTRRGTEEADMDWGWDFLSKKDSTNARITWQTQSTWSITMTFFPQRPGARRPTLAITQGKSLLRNEMIVCHYHNSPATQDSTDDGISMLLLTIIHWPHRLWRFAENYYLP